MAGETLQLQLQRIDAAALNNLLGSTAPRGRKDIRRHSKLFQKLNAACRQFHEGSDVEFDWVEGTVTIDDKDLIDYLAAALDQKTQRGVPGQLAEGYEHLLDKFETHLAKG